MSILEPGHLILILLIALLVFGPKKLPELGKSLGETLREFRRHTNGVSEEISRSLDTPAPRNAAVPAPLPVQTVVAKVSENATPKGE